MKKPIADRITENVIGVLNGLQVVASAHFDASAEAVSSTTNVAGNYESLVVSQGDPEESAEKPINFDEYDLPYSVAYRRTYSENDTNTTSDALHAETFGDIKRVLMADRTRGGLAINTKDWSAEKTDTGGSGAVEGVVNFTVWYRTAQDDVFTSAFEA